MMCVSKIKSLFEMFLKSFTCQMIPKCLIFNCTEFFQFISLIVFSDPLFSFLRQSSHARLLSYALLKTIRR